MAGEARALTEGQCLTVGLTPAAPPVRCVLSIHAKSATILPTRPNEEDTAEVRATKCEKDEIRAYVERQAHEEVVHLEKTVSELAGPVRHDI